MLKTYAKQETVDPVKNLGRFLSYGLLGSLVVGIGVTLLSVAVLRLVQTETETALTGNWSWVPYIAALVISSLGALGALKVIKSSKGKSSKGDVR
ncbi:MAG: hypothetical protein WKF43_07960 [Acidimicrobiales bacterium]